MVQYGERKRPEPGSIGLLIQVQVAYAPRTVPLTFLNHPQRTSGDIHKSLEIGCLFRRLRLAVNAGHLPCRMFDDARRINGLRSFRHLARRRD